MVIDEEELRGQKGEQRYVREGKKRSWPRTKEKRTRGHTKKHLRKEEIDGRSMKEEKNEDENRRGERSKLGRETATVTRGVVPF